MTIPDELSIPLARGKIIAKAFGSLVFVFIGAWMFTDAGLAISAHRNPLFVQGIGLLAVVFFSLTAAYALAKFFDSRPGLRITASGITDNSSGIAVGFVSWSDIETVRVLQIRRTKFLIVKVKNPAKYLETGNLLQQWLRHQNATTYGSPVALGSGMLTIDFDRLARLFEHYLSRYGNPPAGHAK